jgi:hypothetical protein
MLNRFLRNIFGDSEELPVPGDQRRTAATLEPYHLRVSMIIHNPVLEPVGGQTLTQHMRWNDPDELARKYITDLRACSGGLASYEIVERIVVDDYPVKRDGFRYDDASYLRAWQRGSGFHSPDNVDYWRLLTDFDLIAKIERRVIDEVWLFAFPYAGYYESTMAGAGAFWCNSPPVPHTDHIGRRFVIMGFNYERDIGCMLENFGHRVESIMCHVYRNHHGERNLWSRFTRFDRDAPGQSECGNVHFAPNSQSDYDWGNRRTVPCRADTWYTFPDLSGSPRPMNCTEWGNGDMRTHHLWWLEHLPRTEGQTDGVYNNWWHYLLKPDDV